MIAIYTGSGRLSIEAHGEHQELRKNVPTWLPEHFKTAVQTHPLCSEWSGEGVSAHDPALIYVGFSNDLHLFVAAMYAVDKIRRGFPTCEIQATCPPDYRRLLPGYVTYLNYRDGRTDYYRSYQLTQQAVPGNDPWVTRLVPWQRLMLIAGGLFEPDTDKPESGWIMPGATPQPGNIVIIAQGSNPAVTLGGADAVSESLCRALRDANSTAYILAVDKPATDMIKDILRAETTIHLGDSPLCYLSAALGIRTLCFRSSTWTKDTWPNYAHFANVQSVSVEGLASPEALADRIVSLLDSPSKPPAAKRNVEPIQPIYIPKLRRKSRHPAGEDNAE